MSRKQSSAFVTTRKGFCYLTVKVGRSNYNIMRIRNYTLVRQHGLAHDVADGEDVRHIGAHLDVHVGVSSFSVQ